jgi:hypothetical protein
MDAENPKIQFSTMEVDSIAAAPPTRNEHQPEEQELNEISI